VGVHQVSSPTPVHRKFLNSAPTPPYPGTGFASQPPQAQGPASQAQKPQQAQLRPGDGPSRDQFLRAEVPQRSPLQDARTAQEQEPPRPQLGSRPLPTLSARSLMPQVAGGGRTPARERGPAAFDGSKASFLQATPSMAPAGADGKANEQSSVGAKSYLLPQRSMAKASQRPPEPAERDGFGSSPFIPSRARSPFERHGEREAACTSMSRPASGDVTATVVASTMGMRPNPSPGRLQGPSSVASSRSERPAVPSSATGLSPKTRVQSWGASPVRPPLVPSVPTSPYPAASTDVEFPATSALESRTLGLAQQRLTEHAATDLEARCMQLERANVELDKKLDDDAKHFLEALLSLESEVEELTKQNRRLVDERAQHEEQLRTQGTDGELRAKNLKLERECQDMLQQLDEFEREKDEELRIAREDAANMGRQLADQERDFRRRLADSERDRTNLLQAMTEEGRELQSRAEKLNRDKEALSLELAKALARADIAAAGGNHAGSADVGSSTSARELAEATSQLRSVTTACEALKDDVTNKECQIGLLRSQLEIRDRKLRIADMENAMLKSELETLRRSASGAVLPASEPA